MPKLSIILPCYNVEKYISKSIQSVLNQTFTDFELLVVIDGSPDNSKAIAETFSDERITIYEKPNGGLSDARNYGLERAKGEFVYFMDSDDWIEPDLAEKTVNVLEKQNLDLIIFGYIQENEDEEGNLISSKSVIPAKAVYYKKNKDLKLDHNIVGLLGYAWNKVYRRSFLEKHNLKFEKGTSLVEDILFNTQVYSNTESLYFMEKAFYHYYNRPVVTLIKQFHKDSFELKLRRHDSLTRFFKNWNLDIINKQDLLGISIVSGIRYCIHNMFSFKNDMSFTEKVAYIEDMLNHSVTKKEVGFYKPVSFTDKVYKYLIENNKPFTIAILAYLKK